MRFCAKASALVLLTTLSPLLFAQRGAATHAGSQPGRPLQHSSPHNGIYGRGTHFSPYRRQSPYSPYGSLPFPFFTDAFDPGDIYSTGYPIASEPPPYVLQAAAMAASGANPLGRD